MISSIRDTFRLAFARLRSSALASSILILAGGIGVASLTMFYSYMISAGPLHMDSLYEDPDKVGIIELGRSWPGREFDELRALEGLPTLIGALNQSGCLVSPEILYGIDEHKRVSSSLREVTVTSGFIGISDQFRQIHPHMAAVSIGRFFDSREVERAAPAVLIGHTLASLLFGWPERAVGQRIAVEERDYVVVGVLAQGSRVSLSGFSPSADGLVVFPYTTLTEHASSLFYRQVSLTFISYLIPEDVRHESVFRAIGGWVERNRLFDGRFISYLDLVERGDRMGRSGLAAYYDAGTIGYLIAFALAVMTLANMSYASVLQRMEEFALAQALGATPFRLSVLVLAENLILSLAGGLFGLALVGVGTPIIMWLTPVVWPGIGTSLSIASIRFALVVSALMAPAVSVVPCIKAVTMDVSTV